MSEPLGISRQAKTPYITTHTGNKVEFLKIHPSMIRVKDILWHLARTCRFTALMDRWYSNAEHSINVANRFNQTSLARFGLIHDFGEFVTGDIPSPVGRLCPDYKRIAYDVQSQLYIHFIGTDVVPPEIKEADSRMCATEMKFLRNQGPEDYEAEPYTDQIFNCWEWKVAYDKISFYFNAFFPAYKDTDAE